MFLWSSPDHPLYTSENQLVPMIYWVGTQWYTHGKLKIFKLRQNPPFVQYKQEIPTLQMSFHQMLTTILMYVCSLALLTYSLIPQLYGPLQTSAPFMIYTHSSLLFVFCLHLFTFSSCKSFYTSSSHLGLNIFLLSSGLFSKIFLTTLVWAILIACLNHFFC
jgi:hypothetical protein